jgi:hypothetical protein
MKNASAPLMILWSEPDLRNTVDVFPDASLVLPKSAAAGQVIRHRVIGLGGYDKEARCAVHVQGNCVDLDYGGDQEPFNREQEMCIGITRLTFRGSKGGPFADAVDVEWAWSKKPYEMERSGAFVIWGSESRVICRALKITQASEP